MVTIVLVQHVSCYIQREWCACANLPIDETLRESSCVHLMIMTFLNHYRFN